MAVFVRFTATLDLLWRDLNNCIAGLSRVKAENDVTKIASEYTEKDDDCFC